MRSYTQVTSGTNESDHSSDHENGRDRISNLPEGVLGRILSCLPIKDALRTSVLSKYWEFKWTLVDNVDISMCKTHVTVKELRNFFSIVERILSHLQSVRVLSLRCYYSGVGRLMPLISSVLRRDIENLQLDADIMLPRSLLNCPTLRDLSLIRATFKVPVRTCFLSLKSLSLSGVNIVNDNSTTDTISFTLPLLETVAFVECGWFNVKIMELNAPSLTTFSSDSLLEWDEGQQYCSIEVVGAKLAKFEIHAIYPEYIILTGSTVVHASLTCCLEDDHLSFQQYGIQVRKLLREISTVTCLKISQLLQVIGRTKLGIPLPRFHKLEELNVVSNLEGPSDFDAEGLLELLHAAPFLKCLDVVMDEDDYDYELVKSLPSCVVNQLEQVMVEYSCRCIEPTYGFEKFLLKNGLRLKTFSISAVGPNGHRDILLEKEIIEELSTFPKGSTCLTIVGR